MRYFLFAFSCIGNVSKNTRFGNISVKRSTFPSNTEIIDIIHSENTEYSGAVVVGFTEFKSKEDFCNFTRIVINDDSDNEVRTGESTNLGNIWDISPEEHEVVKCAVTDNTFVRGVAYLNNTQDRILIVDRIIPTGIFREKVGACRIYHKSKDGWYNNVKYKVNELLGFRSYYSPIPFKVMAHLISTNFKDVATIRNHQHTESK